MARETILIAEDNEVLQEGLRVLLEVEGYSVLSAGNGREALRQMEDSIPDLILSDIAMPVMDGYALFEEVRQRPEWISIPFIFLTARKARSEIFEGKKLGAEDYLVKPVTRRELITTIRSRLARTEQLMLAQLQQSYDASLIMLANAIELRDQYTRGHVERVRDHTLAIAQEFGWTATRTGRLNYGSILHDIGKIHISEEILQKPGKLTPSEWEQMRKHPLIGEEMVKEITFLAQAVPIIRHHHERWDGKGYPDGLDGERIPFDARIVAVADSLDAMNISRPYNRRLTPEDVYNEILRGAGTQYDPRVVEAFKRVWAKGGFKLR
jgi:putative two-component system response regulator